MVAIGGYEEKLAGLLINYEMEVESKVLQPLKNIGEVFLVPADIMFHILVYQCILWFTLYCFVLIMLSTRLQ